MAITNKELADLLGAVTVGADHTETLNAAYQKAFGRDADAEGLAYWSDRLDNGLAATELMEALLNGADAYVENAEYPANVAVNATDKTTIVNKAEVAEAIQANTAVTAEQAATILATVTTDASKATALTDVAAIVPSETFVLTTALSDLKGANDALTTALEAIESADTTYGGDPEVEAPDVTAANVKAAYDSVAASVGTDTGVTGFGAKTATVQDAYIAAYKTSLSADVSTASAEVPAGTASKLATMESRQEALVELLEADTAANANLEAELAAFANATGEVMENGTSADFVAHDATSNAGSEIYVMTEAQYLASSLNFATNADFVMINGKIYVGTDNSVAVTAIADLTEAARSSQLTAAYNANKAAETAVENGTTALLSTIKELALAENEAYSVKTTDADLVDVDTVGVAKVVEITTTAGSEAVAIDLDVAIDMYETQADSEAATEEVFTADFTTSTAVVGADTIAFDGDTITLAGDETTVEIATAVAGGTYTTYDAVDNGDGTVTFTAKTAADTTDAVAGDFTITDVGGDGTGPVVTVTVDTQGVADAAFNAAAADLSKNLLEAITKQSDFNDKAADFEAARDLENTINALEEAVTVAEDAITNDVDAVEDAGLGLNLITVDAATVAATADADIFLFTGIASDITGTFASDDKLYIGTDYSLVVAAEGEDMTDSLGSVSALEAIVVDDGTNTTIYFEEEAFAGNGSSTTDTVAVELTGVTGQEVSLTDGFITIA